MKENRKPIFIFAKENHIELQQKLAQDLTTVKKINIFDHRLVAGSTVYITDD